MEWLWVLLAWVVLGGAVAAWCARALPEAERREREAWDAARDAGPPRPAPPGGW